MNRIVSGSSNRGLQCGVSSHLRKGQFVSLVIAAEHNSCLRPNCTTSLYSSIPGNRNWQIETADWNLDVRPDI